MADNYVIRERYNGLVDVDGQLIPQRGNVEPGELVATQPVNDGAHFNGGGTESRRSGRRSVKE